MQAEKHEQPGKGDDKICTREFGGEEEIKQMCIRNQDNIVLYIQ